MKTNSKVNYKKGMVAATVATLLTTYGVTTVGATTNDDSINVADTVNVVSENVIVEEVIAVEEEVAVVEDETVVTEEIVSEISLEESIKSDEIDFVSETTRSREILPGTLWDYLPLGEYFTDEKSIAICSEIGGTTFYMVEIMDDETMEIIQTFESQTNPVFDVIDGVSYFGINDGSGYQVLSIKVDGTTNRVSLRNSDSAPVRDVTFGKSVNGSFFVASLGETDYNGLGTTYVSEYTSDLIYMGSYAINPTVIDPIHFVSDVRIENDKVVITANSKEFTFDRASGEETPNPEPPVEEETPNPEPPVEDGQEEETPNPEPPVDDQTPNPEPPVEDGEENGETPNPEPPVEDGEENGETPNPEPPVEDGEENGETPNPQPPVDDEDGETPNPQPPVEEEDGGEETPSPQPPVEEGNGSDNSQNPSIPSTPSNPNSGTTPTLPQTGQLPVGAFAGLASIFSGLGLFMKSKRK